jgi:hypothetical protein
MDSNSSLARAQVAHLVVGAAHVGADADELRVDGQDALVDEGGTARVATLQRGRCQQVVVGGVAGQLGLQRLEQRKGVSRLAFLDQGLGLDQGRIVRLRERCRRTPAASRRE